MAISTYQLTVTLNDPFGSSFMDATAGATYLVTELQTLKADIRSQSLNKTWISLVGLQGVWTGSLAWTVISGTQASIQGDQTVATGTGYIIVGNRVKAFVTAGTIYGTITAATAGGGITTVTVSWDAGAALDSGLTDIQQALDLSKVISSAPTNYATITNTAAAWAGNVAPAILAYVQGAEYRVKWSGAASQGSDTIALNGLAAITVKKLLNGALVSLAAGDIASGDITDLIYDSAGPTMILQQSPSPIAATNLITIYDRSIGNPAVDVVNTTTETTIYTKSISGNTIGTDGALRITAVGDYLNNAGLGSILFTIRVKFGGTTVLTTAGALSFASSANRRPIQVCALIANLGAANAQQVAGICQTSNTSVSNGTFATIQDNLIGEYTGLAIDTTSAQTLAITVEHATANAAIEYRSFAVLVEQIPA